MTPNRDITKLPVWAQRHIQALENHLAAANARLSEGPESDTFADVYSDAPRPLGIEPTIEFRLGGDGDRIRVRKEGDKLYVNSANMGVTVYPASSNALYIKSERH